MTSNGLHPDRNIAWEHKNILLILYHLVTYDQIDVTNISGAELLARRIVMLERAVRANPKSPSFAGLHRMIETGLDDSGGLTTRDYTAYYAKVAADEAQVLKQHRLLCEEKDNAAKHKPPEGLGGRRRRRYAREAQPPQGEGGPEEVGPDGAGLAGPPDPPGPSAQVLRASGLRGPLPLPVTSATAARDRAAYRDRPCGTQQRLQHRDTRLLLVAEIAQALNALDGARAGRPLCQRPPQGD